MVDRMSTTRQGIAESEEHQTTLAAEITSVTKSLSTVTHAVTLLSNIANKECRVKVGQDFHLGDVRDQMKSDKIYKSEKLSWLQHSLASEVRHALSSRLHLLPLTFLYPVNLGTIISGTEQQVAHAEALADKLEHLKHAVSVPLDKAGWQKSPMGETVDGEQQCVGGAAYFKHSQTLASGSVWRTRVSHAHGGDVTIGFAGETLDVKNYVKTFRDSAYVHLGSGTTFIRRLLSEDGRLHCHQTHLQHEIPKTTPYEVALRCEPGSNVPQIQFNDDGTWHDFAPVAKQGSLKLGHRTCQAGAGLARAGLVPGAWYPYLMLNQSARLSDHVVEHLEPE